MQIKSRIDSAAFFVFAIAVLLLPIKWIAVWLVAIIVHELAHYLALRCFHCNCKEFRVGVGWIHMDAGALSIPQIILSTLAGPLASFSLLIFYRFVPELAICGCVHGFVNLLPLFPLDGGRICRCISSHSNKLAAIVAVYKLTMILLLLAGVIMLLRVRYGAIPALYIFYIIGKDLKNTLQNRT